MFSDNQYRRTMIAGLVAALVLQITLVAGVFFFAPEDNLLTGKASAAQPVAVTSPTVEGTDIVADVVARCSPAVVKIETTQQTTQYIDPFFRQFFGIPDQGQLRQRVQQGKKPACWKVI